MKSASFIFDRRLYELLQEAAFFKVVVAATVFLCRVLPTATQAFVPLVFAPGDACQFDWSHEHVELDGVPQTIKVAHFRLAYSR
ncbi:MAG: hypothetical protein Q8Q83_14650, partial [Pseudomonas sp.]|nr:hypothetical protein [Pseudomonas sp.]